MSFDGQTTSQEDSTLTELFLITIGNTEIALTNRSTETVFDGLTYLPSTIDRGSQPTYSIEKAGSEVQISLSEDDEAGAALVSAFRTRAPSGITQLAIVQQESDGSTRSFWTGFIVSVSYDNNRATFLARPLSDIITKTAPRRGFGFLCQHVLFDGRCGLNETSFTHNAIVTALDSTGLIYTIPGVAAATATFVSGQLKETAGFAQGMILSRSGDDFTVRYPIPDIGVGIAVQLIEGCDHGTTDCVALGNIVNYGGFPYTPEDTNPFDKGLDKA